MNESQFHELFDFLKQVWLILLSFLVVSHILGWLLLAKLSEIAEMLEKEKS